MKYIIEYDDDNSVDIDISLNILLTALNLFSVKHIPTTEIILQNTNRFSCYNVNNIPTPIIDDNDDNDY